MNTLIKPIQSYLSAVFMLSFVLLYACSEQAQNSVQKPSGNTGAEEQKALSANQPSKNNGTVKSIINAGGYSYIEVDVDGQLFWLATGISSIQPGEQIAWNSYAIMPNFTSKSLDRVFDQILFVDRVLPTSALARSQHQGTVIEAMDSAGYSYIHVNEGGRKVWLAAPTTQIDPGQTIRWSSGTPMRNFVSKSLQRNFEEIYFVSSVQI